MKSSIQRLGLAAPLICSLLASIALSACASQRMESPGTAWELIQENEVVGAKADQKAPSSQKVVHTRQPVTLSTQEDERDTSSGPALATRSMDDRSPTGWSRSQLVEQWGVPELVTEKEWIYRNVSTGRCASLTLRAGVVTGVKSSC